MSQSVNSVAPEQGTLRCGPFELGYLVEGSGPTALVVGSSIYYPRTFSADLRQQLQLTIAVLGRRWAK